MAEKAEKKPDAASPKGEAAPAADKKHDEKKGGGGFLAKTPVLLGGVMIIEAAVLFAGFKFLGGSKPDAAVGAELLDPNAEHGEDAEGGHGGSGHGTAAGDHGSGEKKPVNKKKMVEIPVVEFRAPNKMSGRTFLYDVSIKLMTKGLNEEKVATAIKEREALIKDRVRTIIAQSDPEKLGGGSEPGLETLKRQVKYQLDEIVGEGMIDEVLVERCIPFRADF